MERYGVGSPEDREAAVAAASLAIQRGSLVLLPTDTVYGIAADAFDHEAVADLLDAKGRGREMPPPVLVSSATTLDALAVRVPGYARALVEEFWPGPLTLVCHAQPSLQWDLGDTRGTVSVRMPLHPVALELLREVGPIAQSSANRSGSMPATTVADAQIQLGESVTVYLDGGPAGAAVPSTIVDLTSNTPRLLREGAVTRSAVAEVLGVTVG